MERAKIEKIVSVLNIEKVTNLGRFQNKYNMRFSIKEACDQLLEHDIVIKPSEQPALILELQKYLGEEQRKKKLAQFEGHGDHSPEVQEAFINKIQRVKPYLDIATGDAFFYDPETSTVWDLDQDIYLALHELTKKELYQNARMVTMTYEPSKPQFYEEGVGVSLIGYLNTFKGAKWPLVVPTDDSKMPHRIETFLTAFIPDPEELEYVLEWMYCVITDRVTPVLCLIGVGGTGKDHLAQLLAHGVGQHNYEKVGDSFLEQFNSQIKNKRLIFYDEVSIIKPEMYNRFKQLTNPYIQYEAKGKDATTIKNHASGVYASNKPEEVPFMPGERRFSVPRLTNTPLLTNFQRKYGEVKGKEEQEQFSRDMLSYDLSDDVVNFYHWLTKKFLSKDVNRTKQHPLITSYSLELAHKNLADWKREIVEHLEENFHLRYHFLKEIKARIEPDRRKLFPRSNTISKFLSEYVDENGITMGSISRGSRGKKGNYREEGCIRISDEFFEKMKKKSGRDIEIIENTPEDDLELESEEFEEFSMKDLEVSDTIEEEDAYNMF